MKIMKSIITLHLTFLISAISSFAVYAATPSISSINGTISHGGAVTVTGAGFGVKSPVAPSFWDTVSYSGLSNGGVVPIGGSNAWPGYCGDVPVHYKTTNPRGKWTAHYTNDGSSDSAKKGAMDGAIVPGVTTTKKMYVTWWNYLSSIPQQSNESNKWLRALTGAWGAAGQGTIIWTPDTFYSFDFSSSTYLGGNHWDNSMGNYPAWNRMEFYVDSSVSYPAFSAWVNGVLSGSHNTGTTVSWGPVNQLGCLGFDGSNLAASQQPTVDWGEIYADNTLARVEICNTTTKSGSNHCEIQIPQTQWIDGTLQIKVNQGSFADGSTAYLYVIDASGNVSTTNSASTITFGSGGAYSTGPPSVKNVKATVTLSN